MKDEVFKGERRSVINNGLKGEKKENRLRFFLKKEKNTEKEVGDFFNVIFADFTSVV